MPRLVHSVPKYRRHRASGQAIVTLSGKDHYLGPHGSKASKVAYDRVVTEWLAADRHLPITEADELTVVEAIARYWGHAKGHYRKNGKPTSEQAGIKASLRFLKVLYGQTPAREFTPVALKAVRARMVDNGLARSTTNQHVSRIRRMFKWLGSEGLVPPTVPQALMLVDGLRRGRTTARETNPVKPVSDAIVDATLPHLPAVVADMVRLQRLTGMRPSEVCSVRPCDLDRTSDVWQYLPKGHKTEHHDLGRMIFIGPRAQEVLLKYLIRDATAQCFQPADSEAKRRAQQHARRIVPMSCGTKPGDRRKRRRRRAPGDRYGTASYRRAITRACEQAFPAPPDVAADPAGLKKWRAENNWAPNRLRHTAGTEIRRQFGLEAAQVTLGHTKANTTQIYAERDYALAARVAREVG